MEPVGDTGSLPRAAPRNAAAPEALVLCAGRSLGPLHDNQTVRARNLVESHYRLRKEKTRLLWYKLVR